MPGPPGRPIFKAVLFHIYFLKVYIGNIKITPENDTAIPRVNNGER